MITKLSKYFKILYVPTIFKFSICGDIYYWIDYSFMVIRDTLFVFLFK